MATAEHATDLQASVLNRFSFVVLWWKKPRCGRLRKFLYLKGDCLGVENKQQLTDFNNKISHTYLLY